MSRSLYKLPICKISLQQKFNDKHIINTKIKSYITRSSVILPQHLDKFFFVHNGKTYLKLKITSKMIGHKFGNYIFTKIKYGSKN